jgi:hypothetical protein
LGGLGVSAGVTAISDEAAAATAEADDVGNEELCIVLFGASSCFGPQAALSNTTVDNMPKNVLFIVKFLC